MGQKLVNPGDVTGYTHNEGTPVTNLRTESEPDPAFASMAKNAEESRRKRFPQTLQGVDHAKVDGSETTSFAQKTEKKSGLSNKKADQLHAKERKGLETREKKRQIK